MVGIFSKGILRTVPWLEELLGNKVVLNPRSPEGLIAVAGWGHKPTAKEAMQKAREWNLPYWALEEGFIRSISPEEPSYSLIVDPVGIYYNANQPSLLEDIIKKGIDKDLLNRGEEFLRMVLKHRISKYNNYKPLPEGYFPRHENRVLIIDQTYSDMSVVLGRADSDTFVNMFHHAVREHPKATIYIKVHPLVIAGKKKGYLYPHILKSRLAKNRVRFIVENFNPLDIVENFSTIYTVSSQMGFEGVLMGRKVVCFGMPFYAGWGITEDIQSCERRGIKRSVLEVFTCAYLVYTSYMSTFMDKILKLRYSYEEGKK